jgi:hypothetical protein
MGEGRRESEKSAPALHAALPSWLWAALFVALAAWGLTDVRWRGSIDPDDPLVHKSDFTVFTEAGAAFFDGRNPYDVSNPRGWKYLYPPLFAIAVAPLAKLDPQWQAVVWYFISLLICCGCYRESLRVWRVVGPVCRTGPDDLARSRPADGTYPPAWLGVMAAATLALPTFNCLQRGQVGVLIAYLMILGLRLVLKCRSWRGAFGGGVALALAITIKFTPILPVGILLATLFLAAFFGTRKLADGLAARPTARAWGAIAGTGAGMLLFLFALPSLFVGPAANWRHLQTWVDRVVVHRDMGAENNSGFYSVRNQSLDNAVARLGNWAANALAGGPSDELTEDASGASHAPVEPADMHRALTGVKALLAVLLLAVVWRAARLNELLEIAAVSGLACTLALIVSPLSWAHHYLLWLPALVTIPCWLWQSGHARWAKRLAIAPCVLMVVHYVLLDWSGRAGVLGLGTTVWFIAACTIPLRRKAKSRGDAETRSEEVFTLRELRASA